MMPVTLLSLVFAAVAVAQVPNPPSERLTTVRNVRCTFPVLATGTWVKGEAQGAIKPATLTVGFNNIDTQEGTAEAVGGAGKSHITVRLVGNYLNLMQMDPYGALYVTTIFGTETKPGRLQAVHTRHEYLPVSAPGFTSRPEQYYGDCEVARGTKN